MAHIEKCKGAAAVALILHDERKQGEKDKHIDPTLKHLNYNLCDRGDSIGYMHKRIKEIMQEKTLRKDAVKAISLIVTCPQDLPEHEQEKFLKSAYDFAVKEYGEKNIISAWVHRDEPGAMPHIHIKAVAAVIDKETGKEKLSAKELVTRGYLKKLHPRLQKHVEQELGHPVSVINGATAGKNRAIAELKAEEALERAKKAHQEVQRAKEQLITLEDTIKPLKVEYEAYKTVLENKPDLHQVQTVKKILDKKEYVKMPMELFEELRQAQAILPAAKAALEKTEFYINEFLNAPDRNDIAAYMKRIEKAKEAAENKVKFYEQKIKQLPEYEQKLFREEQQKNTHSKDVER